MDKTIELSETVQLRMVQATSSRKEHFRYLVDDDELLDAYIIYIQDGQADPNIREIGVVWQGLYGWNTVPFVGVIGHNGFDTAEEATEDLYSVYKEHR